MRVLLVDDDAAVRHTVRAMLEDAGVEVEEAADGDEGSRSYRRRPTDVVLCDLFMPGKDGLQLIRELRRDFPGVKVVAMSGGALGGRLDQLRAARCLGALEVLRKPADRDAILAALGRALAA